MKYIYNLSILALLFFIPVKSQESKIANLMGQRNGSFESTTGGWAKGNNSHSISFEFTSDESNSYNSNNNSKSLKVTFGPNAIETGQEVIKHNSLTVNDSQYLIYSLWVKAQAANTIIRFRTVESSYKKSNPFRLKDTNWHNIVIKSENTSGNIVNAGTSCGIQIVADLTTTPGAVFFIDDITLTSGLFDTGFDVEAFSRTNGASAIIELPVTADPGSNNTQHNWNPSKIWTTVPQGPEGSKTDQVESMEYSTTVKYNGSKSLKVVTKSTTTNSLMAVVNPKQNNTWQFRYKTPANPTVEGSDGVSNNFDKIKYTLSYYMKTAANTDGVNKTNVKILGTDNYVTGDQSVPGSSWKKFEVSKIFDRGSITESEIYPIFRFSSASTTYYVDNIKLTWEEGNDTTFSSNSIDYPRLSIYPNPAQNYFIAENAVINDNLEIFNVGGKLIKTQTIYSVNEKIDIKELNRGIYFVRVNDSRAVRLIKK